VGVQRRCSQLDEYNIVAQPGLLGVSIVLQPATRNRHRIASCDTNPSESFDGVLLLVQVRGVAIDRRLILCKDYIAGKLLVALLLLETQLIGVLQLTFLLGKVCLAP